MGYINTHQLVTSLNYTIMKTYTFHLSNFPSLRTLLLLAVLFSVSSLSAQDVFLTSQSAVDGFTGTTAVNRDLVISGTDIVNLDGLSSLSTVGRFLQIQDNPMLTNVDGLSSLSPIGVNLVIIDNPMLANVDGLSSLSTIDFLDIRRNTSLINVDGLSSLGTVNSNLLIGDNPMLTNVDGLSSLSMVGGNLNILRNTSLSLCCGVFPLLDGGTIGSTITIRENTADCNSADQITAGGPCAVIPTMSQWALFILGLSLTSLAVVRIRKVAFA